MPRLLALRNGDITLSDDMEDALNWFCCECNTRGSVVVTEEEVKAWLRDEEGRPDLAEQFTPNLLYPYLEDFE